MIDTFNYYSTHYKIGLRDKVFMFVNGEWIKSSWDKDEYFARKREMEKEMRRRARACKR